MITFNKCQDFLPLPLIQTKKHQMVRFWRKIFNFYHIIGIKNFLFTNKTDKKIEFGPHLSEIPRIKFFLYH